MKKYAFLPLPMVLIDYVHVLGISQTVQMSFFARAKVMGNVEILIFFENPFFTKLLDIGEVFVGMKNNNQVKVCFGSRGEMYVVSAIGQKLCISKVCRLL